MENINDPLTVDAERLTCKKVQVNNISAELATFQCVQIGIV